MGIAMRGDRVYLAAGLFGIEVIDVSNPLVPEWVDNVFLSDVVDNVSVSGNLVAASTWCDGMTLVGMTESDATILGNFEPQHWVLDTYLAGPVAHILLPNGRVQQVDVANPTKPSDLGVFDDASRAVSARTGDGFMLVPDDVLLGGIVESFEVVEVPGIQ